MITSYYPPVLTEQLVFAYTDRQPSFDRLLLLQIENENSKDSVQQPSRRFLGVSRPISKQKHCLAYITLPVVS